MAKILKKRATSPGGLVLELLGFVLLFAFPIGTIFGITFLIVGYGLSQKTVCSACGNKVEDKTVKICPVCKVVFS